MSVATRLDAALKRSSDIHQFAHIVANDTSLSGLSPQKLYEYCRRKLRFDYALHFLNQCSCSSPRQESPSLDDVRSFLRCVADSQQLSAQFHSPLSCASFLDGEGRLVHSDAVVDDRDLGDARVVDCFFDAESRCWLESDSGQPVPEFLQLHKRLDRFWPEGCRPFAVGRVQRPALTAEESESGFTVYLATVHHFGHFITNSASGFPALVAARAFLEEDPKPLRIITSKKLSNWQKQMLIDFFLPEQVLIFETLRQKLARRCLRVRRMVVRHQTWLTRKYCHRNHGLFFSELSRSYLKRLSISEIASVAPARPGIYLSRSKVTKSIGRVFSNEVELERVLDEMNILVLHPQLLPRALLAFYLSQARFVVGPVGSNMHNILFADRGKPLGVATFTHRSPANDASAFMIENVLGCRQNFYFRDAAFLADPGRDLWTFDLNRCRAAVELLIDSYPV